MAKKSKIEELTSLLKDLEAITPDIEASAVVSVDGLMKSVGPNRFSRETWKSREKNEAK